MDNLHDILAHYNSLNRPGYALLVTGAWGVGKTFRVRDTLNALDAGRKGTDALQPSGHAYISLNALDAGRKGTDALQPSGHAYISLFGLSDARQIDEMAVAALDCTADAGRRIFDVLSRGTAAFKGPVAAASVALDALASPIIARALEGASHRTLVVDDLERASIEPDVLLGVLNRYVEHYGFRLVIIAHDEKIKENSGTSRFSEIKEKLIGLTVRVEPDLHAAWSAFVARLSDGELKDQLLKHEETILEAFKGSEVQSLRVLQYLIGDAVRLTNALDERLLESQRGMAMLFRWLFSAGAMVRDGSLDEAVYLDTMLFHQQEVGSKPKLGAIEYAVKKRSCFASYEARALSLQGHDRLDLPFLKEGKLDPVAWNARLAQVREFSDPDIEPEWKAVWWRFKRDPEEWLVRFDEMEKRFSERDYIDLAELLHVFSLRLSLARDGIFPSIRINDVFDQCDAYLGDPDWQEKLDINLDQKLGDLSSWTGAYGLGFAGESDQSIRQYFELLFEKLTDVYENVRTKRRAESALALMDMEPEAFAMALGVEPLLRAPVLADIQPSVFLDKIFCFRASEIELLAGAINQRWQQHDVKDLETDWYCETVREFDTRLQEMRTSDDVRDRARAYSFRWLFYKDLRDALNLGDPPSGEVPPINQT